MYTLHSDFNITGYLYDRAIKEPEEIFGRQCPIYFATILCDDPMAKDLILQAYEEFAGPRCSSIELQGQPKETGLLRFESILRPNYGILSDTKDVVQPGDYVELQVRLEHADNEDQTVIYPRLVLRSITLASEQNQLDNDYWENFEDNGYNF